jgi:ArsR family transcriptional regulator, arsenate/arsenite/antimonite-responsive transcriptional repressor
MRTRDESLDDGLLVRVLKALAHARRFQMVKEIAESGELSCGEIGKRFPLAQPTISHHLKILIDAGVLLVRREAQHGFLSVNRDVLDPALRTLPGRLARSARRR